MTKVFHTVYREPSGLIYGPAADPNGQGCTNQYGLSRKCSTAYFDSVKHSLGRLQLDYIDVLQCQRFDYNTSVAETISMPSSSPEWFAT